MSPLPGRLGELRARDVMTSSVITLRETDTLTEAVRKLKENHITGAPVVNTAGKLVGILSISDLCVSPSSTAESKESGDKQRRSLSQETGSATWALFEQAQPLSQRDFEETVQSRMSSAVASVREDASLVEVARVMCAGHWHRVPVVNQAGALEGIISSMDLLAALVNASDEATR